MRSPSLRHSNDKFKTPLSPRSITSLGSLVKKMENVKKPKGRRLHDRCICCILSVESSNMWPAMGAVVVSFVVLLFQAFGVVRLSGFRVVWLFGLIFL
jgi:hypothetical protein